VKTIEPGFSVAPQITPADVPVLAAAGIKTIVNNRPDNEAPGQPSGAAIEAAARAHGLEYVHLPVVSGKLEDKDAAALAKVLEASKGPVLAFCRSGSRTTALWALSQAGHRPPDELIRKAAAAGYDLRPLIPRLQSRVTQR
jgi:sulfide:quinone oxidoreductase